MRPRRTGSLLFSLACLMFVVFMSLLVAMGSV